MKQQLAKLLKKSWLGDLESEAEVEEDTMSATTYRIEGRVNGNWEADVVGSEGNEFDSVAEAEAAIEELRGLGEDWADGEYRVVPMS